MKCREVEEALAMSNAGRTSSSMQPVLAHIKDCRHCQDIAWIVELPIGEAQVESDQIERLEKMIVDDLRPVRPLPPAWVFLAAFAVIFIGLTTLGVFYLGANGWFALMTGQKIAIFSTLAGSAALLAFSLVRQMVPGEKSLFRPALLPIPIFVLLCLVIASVFQARIDQHFMKAGEACLKAGVPYAIPAALVFWLILRRGAILSARAVGAITGMLAGLVSTTVLEIHCAYLNVWHILVWHVGIALLGMIVGLLVAIVGQAMQRSAS